jgi:protoporphyrinogen/coproporphyrinogen III oxidase
VTPAHVVVVGGGISGLAAAWAIRAEAADAVRVTVLEGSGSIGGKIGPVRVAGVDVDAGAESMLARRPEAVALAEAVGLRADLIHPATSGAGVWTRGSLRPLPAGQLMGIPGDLRALAASGVVSGAGLARIPLDCLLPMLPVGTDVAIGRYVAARMGREVVDRLVEPLLGGVYAGHADEISLAAAVPQLMPALREERSLLAAVGRVLWPDGRDEVSEEAPAPVFASLRDGLHRLPAAVAAASGARVRTGMPVRQLVRVPAGWQLVTGPARAPETIEADAVVLAVPAAPAARLLGDIAPYPAAELAAVEAASVAVVTFAFADDGSGLAGLGAPNALRGTGFLVPPVERRTVKAVTYLSQKWGRSEPEPVTIVRASVGRHREESDLQRDDADLAGAVLADVAAATGITARPVDVAVSRWGGALPQYAVGHVQRVDRIRRGLEPLAGLEVCGATYDGVGIAACVWSARQAATRLVAGLERQGQWRHG